MSNLFGNLKTEGLEAVTDRVGGDFSFDTDVYKAKVKVAYLGKSPKGAHFLGLTFLMPDGREYNEDVYFTNRDGENFYVVKKDGKPTDKKAPLPGFTLVNDLLLVTTGKQLSELTSDDVEERVIKLYDRNEKKEMPTKVNMVASLLDAEVGIAVQKSEETQMEKDSEGAYTIPTDKSRFTNNIEKVLVPASLHTVSEATNGNDAEWATKWAEKNKGTIRDKKYKGNAAVKSGMPGRAPAAGGTAPQQTGAAPARTSLFPGRKS